jgi:hypothetical protein
VTGFAEIVAPILLSILSLEERELIARHEVMGPIATLASRLCDGRPLTPEEEAFVARPDGGSAREHRAIEAMIVLLKKVAQGAPLSSQEAAFIRSCEERRIAREAATEPLAA